MTDRIAKPFLKWAGGKTQLISDIEKALPIDFHIKKYAFIEPFVGSGAILFWVLNNFPKLKKAVINDINADLINTYKVISGKPKDLISILEVLQNEYHHLSNDEEAQKEYYYKIRELYNTRTAPLTDQAAFFIFLNKSGFNGIYRVNKNNLYNVPKGSSRKPPICSKENLLLVSEALQKVEILCGDFEKTIHNASTNSFFYFDPPYKPLSNTSSFNSYASDEFSDEEQIRLRNFCLKLDRKGYKWMLSNSDVKGKNPSDNFFDEIYSDFSINRVMARRSLNSDGTKRGKLTELLITNYNYEQTLQTA
jgi:DNA adenine methylase